MALTQTLSTDYPLDATWWKITFFSAEREEKTLRLVLRGWKDQASYDAGDAHLAQRVYQIVEPDYNDYFSVANLNAQDKNPVSIGYQYVIDTDADFSSGTLAPE